VHETRFYRNHMDAAVVKPVTQALKINGQPTLGGPIEVIALTATVPCNRRDPADKSPALLLKVVGQDIESQRGSGKVRIQNPARFVPVLARRFGISQVARAKNNALQRIAVRSDTRRERRFQ